MLSTAAFSAGPARLVSWYTKRGEAERTFFGRERRYRQSVVDEGAFEQIRIPSEMILSAQIALVQTLFQILRMLISINAIKLENDSPAEFEAIAD